MQDSLRKKLRQALAKIDRPGSFCTSGSVPAVLPGLAVTKLGYIGLPLSARQAEELKEHCEQAPYGKGEQTVVDTNVRRVWRLTPDKFKLTNPDWKDCLHGMIESVRNELGLVKHNLEGHLYDLLLYEPGSFFLPHRDGEKLDRMVATLVVVLPSVHEGGELVIRHDGMERIIDLGGADKNAFQIQFAAFYADCEHEVRSIHAGYRLCLIYNLTLAETEESIDAPRASENIEQIGSILKDWAKDDSAGNLVITLDHQYTEKGLSWDALKGADRAKADILADAAQSAGCHAYLGLLTFWESGSVEGGYDYGRYERRGRWYSDDDENDTDDEDADDGDIEGKYEMGEVYDTSLSVKQSFDRAGNPMPFEELKVNKDEDLLDPDALREVKPKENFEGYTGNAGMTLERWYRHAAVILWPEEQHFNVVCRQNVASAVPMLQTLVSNLQQPDSAQKGDAKAKCLSLARAILDHWRPRHAAFDDEEKAEKTTLLESLLELDDAGLVRRFVSELMVADTSLDPGKSITDACERYGWSAFQRELITVFQISDSTAIVRNARVLKQFADISSNKIEHHELRSRLADELVAALVKFDQPKQPHDWRAANANRTPLLQSVGQALLAAEQTEALSQLIAHALADRTHYPMAKVVLPALINVGAWVKDNPQASNAGLSQWISACRNELETLTATMPQKPADYRRPATLSCKCELCKELAAFLHDPAKSTHRFSTRQDRRNHLENSIRQERCDLDCKTERTRSPHTLVCTKNTNSYEEALKKYHADVELLRKVRDIEGSATKPTPAKRAVRQGKGKR